MFPLRKVSSCQLNKGVPESKLHPPIDRELAHLYHTVNNERRLQKMIVVCALITVAKGNQI